mgnify:CR=1 FL=1
MSSNKGYEFLDNFPPKGAYFYKEHNICLEQEVVSYNQEFEKNFEVIYKDYYDLKPLDQVDKHEIFERIEHKFLDMLEAWEEYYEPIKYDAKIAIECGLLPFTWNTTDASICLLACGEDGLNYYTKLDAYQLLTSKSISKNSDIFTNPESFKKVLGDEVYNKMQEILGGGNGI